jgi:hypothetical protein
VNLDQLKSAGGIVSDKPVRQEIVWNRTTDEGVEETLTFDVYVVRLAYGDYEQLYMPTTRTVDDDDAEPERHSLQSELISLCIRLGENADERLTYEQAYRLQPGLAAAMIRAINKVMGKAQKKPDRDGRAVARTGSERDRGTDDRGSEAVDERGGVSPVDGVLPSARNAEPGTEDGVGLRAGSSPDQ